MKKLIISIISLLVLNTAMAQHEYLYTQYFNNLIYYNPAATGSNEYHTATSFYRQQWAGVKGAPWNGLISYDAPFKKVNMGLGGYVTREVIGINEATSIIANYAYHIKTGDKARIGLGISGGIDIFSAKFNNLTVWDEGDINYANAINGKVIPHFGFGIFFKSEKIRVGISIPRLLSINTENLVKIGLTNAPNLRRHYYLTAEYDFTIKDQWKITPTTMMRYVFRAPFQADIGVRAAWKDQLFFGSTYRTLGFVTLFAQYKIKDLCRIGYSFDFSTTAMRQFGHGTHEVMISFEFLKDKNDKSNPKH